MLENAFFAAKFNVYINLEYIKDDKYIKNIHAVLSEAEETMPKQKDGILHKCEDVIIKG